MQITEERKNTILDGIRMFLLAFMVMTVETIYFHLLLITTNYLRANFLISIAMLGIACGGILGFYLARKHGKTIHILLPFALLISLVLAYFNITHMGLFKFPYFLILPFLTSSLLVAILFTKPGSHLLYFINLMGSVSGLLFPVFAVQTFGSENTLILILGIPLFLLLISTFQTNKKIPRIVLFSLITIGLASVFLLFRSNTQIPTEITLETIQNKVWPGTKPDSKKFLSEVLKTNNTAVLKLDSSDKYEQQRLRNLLVEAGCLRRVNLLWDITPHPSLDQYFKIFGTSFSLVYSEDNLMGRIDYLSDGTETYLSVNGNILDQLDPRNGAQFDPRVPHIPENPKIFIIGLSADGIVKSCKRIPGAQVSGIEINPVIMRTMRDLTSLSLAANRPYSNVTTYQGEGRYHLASTSEKYDMITLMNIHPEQSAINTYCPENFHTVEGLTLLLDKLTDKGILVFEEIIIGKRTEFFFLKFLNTLRVTLRQRQQESAASNIYIFEWDFNPSGNVFRTVLVRPVPFTADELTKLAAYLEGLKKTGHTFNVKLLHSPHGNEATTISSNLRTKEERLSIQNIPVRLSVRAFTNTLLNLAQEDEERSTLLQMYYAGTQNRFYHLVKKDEESKRKTAVFLRSLHFPVDITLAPATDDKPFPYDVHSNRNDLWSLLKTILFLTLFLMIPVFLILLIKHKTAGKTVPPSLLFLSLTGFAFMLVEIVLMQYYQRFIGNSTYSLMIVLGTLLFFGGLGSLFSKRFGPKASTISVLSIPLMLLLIYFFRDALFLLFAHADFPQKTLISILSLAPLSFLMGIPFPHVLERVRQKASPEFAALIYGVNGAFATVGSASTLMLSVTFGLQKTMLIGIICYACASIIFLLLQVSPKEKTDTPLSTNGPETQPETDDPKLEGNQVPG